ncbi:alpha/beta hydrolase [Mucilaginibacter galii]|uniref:IroE protein n=1 Tax=Mucilaginibacter galii TaxID=2005073 RepID=A0A917J8L4_9SPHI|nr:alpha/beta hydrolase-fold protein [Mucilaginibacter galii]GGI51008.1 IroE protein [Mucilaginibacter galii]
MTTNFTKPLLLLGVIYSFLSVRYANAQTQHLPLVTIPQSQHQVMHSAYAKADYEIDIHLPDGYETSKTPYPVLFVVDGANDFAPTLEYLGLLMAEYHITEPIVVAIGDGGRIGTPGNRRNQDFTPSAITGIPKSGGAGAFLPFIEKELLPYISANYKADASNRTLYGYSMGGLFATYVLFQKPQLFKNILIGSPALAYDNGKIFDYEKAYAASHKDLPVHVFIEVGELETPEMIEPNKRMVQQLKNRNYPNLDMHSIIQNKVTHLTGKPTTMLKALAWAYTKPHVVD